MVAGEFAVLIPHHDLIVMAVDRYVKASIHKSEENQLHLQNFQMKVKWNFSHQKININKKDERLRFIAKAMEITLQYLQEQNISTFPFTLTVQSELDDASGRKYGLGSSAAVVTAGVKAILHRFLPERPTKELIFKLAAIAHTIVQGKGSGADIAASTFGGVLRYRSFQAEWLLAQYQQSSSITEFIQQNWTYLEIERLRFPKNLYLCIGWTGNPASTVNLVEKVLQFKNTNPTQFSVFLTNSQEAVETILRGIKEQDEQLFFKGVRLNRRCLATLGKEADVDIETPLLKKLSDTAVKLKGAGKLSGAGGGDCGIAFMQTKEEVKQLQKKWIRYGIQPLHLSLSEHTN